MFSLRKIVSLTLLFAFLMLVYTGVMLYIAPQGRIAYWAIWRFLGLTKDQYTDIHILFSVVFIISGVLHIYYNWKAILHYLKNKAKKLVVVTPDFLVAFAIFLVTFFGTYYGVPPFSTVINFSDKIKTYWEKEMGAPPVPHAELLSLENFCKRFHIDLDKVMDLLNSKGIKVDNAKLSLKEIAVKNGTTPQKIYDIIKNLQSQSVKTTNSDIESDIPSGLGRLTLEEMCKLYGIDYEKAKDILRKKGFDFDENMRLKDISAQQGMLPSDIYLMLKKSE